MPLRTPANAQSEKSDRDGRAVLFAALGLPLVLVMLFVAIFSIQPADFRFLGRKYYVGRYEGDARPPLGIRTYGYSGWHGISFGTGGFAFVIEWGEP